MEFNSLFFIFLYLPLFVGLMYFIKNNEFRNIIILVFSVVFYTLGDIKNLGILIGISLLSYLVSKYVKHNKPIYIAYLIVVVTILAFFKYGNYIFSSINAFSSDGDILNIVMPLGISFFIFTSISYVSDCYYGKIEADKNMLNVFTYLTFFPTIVSGPILRYEGFKKYLLNKEINTDSIASGLRQFVLGLSKKVLLANQLAIIANLVYSDSTKLSLPLAWYGTLAYMMQIYFDFSGYSDMAIAVSKMIGFEIPKNFDYPYISKNPQEFWRRWHISLSTWFKDYVYIPLGGNRVSTVRWVINISIVWLLTGVWHGSTINYVLWGIFNGVVLIIYKFINKKDYGFISWLFTMAIVFVGWLIFRSNSLHQIKMIVKALIGLGEPLSMMYIKSLDVLYLLPYFGIAFVCCFPFVQNILNKIENKCPVIYDVIILVLFFINIVFIISGSYSSFIYFSF